MPIFPLQRAILLPRANVPLNVFEPRYLEMLQAVLSSSRVLGIVQPQACEEESPAGKSFALRPVGCAGRVTAYQELDDGRLIITITGIARCALREEVVTPKPYRIWAVSYEPFASDFVPGAGEDEVDRERMVSVLKRYLDARNLSADWPAILRASNERLINALAIASPFGPEEKQALLEAPDLKARAEVLVALAEMELAGDVVDSGSTIQ
jgi:Lon protease-like protein